MGFVLSPFYKCVPQSDLAGRLSLDTYLISNWHHSFCDCLQQMRRRQTNGKVKGFFDGKFMVRGQDGRIGIS